jgi:hypothetical protein
MSQPIRLKDHGDRVRAHQRHLNDRLRAHGHRPVEVTGACDAPTIDRSAFAAWFLGALTETVAQVQGGTITPGVQTLVADPGARNDGQRRRARERRGQSFPSTNGSGNGFAIVRAADWGAVAPTGQIIRVGRPTKIIFHHTDGHHPELDHQPGDSLAEAKAFARAIQRDHMHRTPTPFIDSGHNFLVTRSGHILEGRHGSLDAINAGVMVGSAHCVGQNSQPGIEHEHIGGEAMTPAQRRASLFLHELICRKTGIRPGAIHGHGEFNPTECPGALKGELADFRHQLTRRLAA